MRPFWQFLKVWCDSEVSLIWKHPNQAKLILPLTSPQYKGKREKGVEGLLPGTLVLHKAPWGRGLTHLAQQALTQYPSNDWMPGTSLDVRSALHSLPLGLLHISEMVEIPVITDWIPHCLNWMGLRVKLILFIKNKVTFIHPRALEVKFTHATNLRKCFEEHLWERTRIVRKTSV